MALMVAFGFMNIGAMVALALLIYAERFWFPGRWFRRLTGVASLALGVVVAVTPSVAAGLHQVAPMVHQMPHM
jgi:predicted metal-binding membrane protein